MTHQLSIVLSDEEYAELTAESAKSGATIEAVVEAFVHERLTLHGSEAQTDGSNEILGALYHQGVVAHLPTGESETADEEAEAERLAHLYGGGQSAAEMVIEDRGPY